MQWVNSTAGQKRVREADGTALTAFFLMLRAAILDCRKGPR